MKKILLSFLVVLLFNLIPVFAGAEAINTSDLPWERFNFRVGGFFNAVDSSIRYGTSGAGLEVNLEDALGLDTSMIVFKTDASWRFTDNLRHRFDVSWFSMHRKSSKVLEQDLDFGDYNFPAGTKAEGAFNYDIVKTAYSYSYFQDDRFDLAASFGFYTMPIGFKVKSDVGDVKKSNNLIAPLPVFGIRNDFAITPKIFLINSMDFFYVEYDQFRGALTDIQVAVEYKAFEHVGFGLGAESFRLKIKSEKSTSYPGVDFDGRISSNYLGVMFYVSAYY